MAKRIGGFRRKTRYKLQKNIRLKGKLSLTRYFQEFQLAERVLLLAEPSIQRGMYFPRYHGKVGKIVGKKGRCYQVSVRDGGQQKTFVVHPVHLRKEPVMGPSINKNNHGKH